MRALYVNIGMAACIYVPKGFTLSNLLHQGDELDKKKRCASQVSGASKMLNRSRQTSLLQQEMAFPLLSLPDEVVIDILDRCPQGSICFSLPLALAQVRLTGTVDPTWLRPLLRASARSPSVRQKLVQHLRTVRALPDAEKELDALLPLLGGLRSFEAPDWEIPGEVLHRLPLTLTRLVFNDIRYSRKTSNSLLSTQRILALEELEPPTGITCVESGISRRDFQLFRLRRAICSGDKTLELISLAPRLEALKVSEFDAEHAVLLAPLAGTLTSLSLSCECATDVIDITPVLDQLTGLEHLRLSSEDGSLVHLDNFGNALSQGLAQLSRLEISGPIAPRSDLVDLARAFKKGMSERQRDLDLCISGIEMITTPDDNSNFLLEHLVDLGLYFRFSLADNSWRSLTRLTRLDTTDFFDVSMPGSDKLPLLTALQELNLSDPCPLDKIQGLTDLTSLRVPAFSRGPGGRATCRPLRKLKTLVCQGPLDAEVLSSLPVGVTKLDMGTICSTDSVSTRCIQHLTALQDLRMRSANGDQRATDLSAFRLLTHLFLTGAWCPQIRLGSLPCLREMTLSNAYQLSDTLLSQLGGLGSLTSLMITSCTGEPLSEVGLAPLTGLPLLSTLELPERLQLTAQALPLLYQLNLETEHTIQADRSGPKFRPPSWFVVEGKNSLHFSPNNLA